MEYDLAEYPLAKAHELVGLYRAAFILKDLFDEESLRVIGVGDPETMSGMEACMNAIKNAINTEHEVIPFDLVSNIMFR